MTTPSLLLTGCRSGEYITGLRTQALGCILQLKCGTVPPETRTLDTLRAEPAKYTTFLYGLGSIPYFRELSQKRRAKHLECIESTKDTYLQDVEGLQVRIVKPGGDFLKLPQEILTELSTGFHPITKLYSSFPSNPSSSGLKGRHTLVLRRDLWAVSTPVENVYCKAGSARLAVVDSRTLKAVKDYVGEAIKLNGVDSGPLVRCSTDVQALPHTLTSPLYTDGLSYLFRDPKWPPSYLKSLIQKIVRHRPLYVVLDQSRVVAESLLASAVRELFQHPGSFVPDLQSFVTGQESALKRAVIILLEDGYAHASTIRKLAYGALLAQRFVGWRATPQIVDLCVHALVSSLRDVRYYDWESPIAPSDDDIQKGSNNALRDVLHCVKICGSFASDIRMVETLCDRTEERVLSSTLTSPKSMHISTFIDAHCLPGIVYYIRSPESYNYTVHELLVRIFTGYTGVNTRKQALTGDKWMREVIRAQNQLYNDMSPEDDTHTVACNGVTSVRYRLDDSWIAGLVGSFETPLRAEAVGATARGYAITTMDPNNLSSLVTVRKPSRGMKSPLLDDCDAVKVERYIRSFLEEGIPLDATTPPMRELKGAVVYAQAGKPIMVKLKGSSALVKWDKLKKGVRSYPYDNAVVKEWVKSCKIEAIRRLYTLFTCSATTVQFPNYGREGKALSTGVPSHKDDRLAYTSFMELLHSTNFLGETVVQGRGITTFHVADYIVLHAVKKRMRRRLVPTSDKQCTVFGDVGEKETRRLWEHQKTAIEAMESSRKRGRKGHFIYADVGSGKTKLVLEYICRALATGSVIGTVLYTLPSSAMSSVIHEIASYGFDYRVLIPTVSARSKKDKTKLAGGCDPSKIIYDAVLPQGVIVLIEHDHIRRVVNSEKLCEAMPRTMFVIDEVHKALNNTLRTGACLYLSKLCDEFIALTGTPVIDTDTYKLRWWLECIVDFGVNEHSFWVAACGIVSRRVSTPYCKVRRRSVHVNLLQKDMKEYARLAPVSCGGANHNVSPNDVRRAMELCYNSTDVGIVKLAISKLKQGVFIVANNAAHQHRLKEKLITAGVKGKSIFLITSTDTLYLTPDTPDTPRYKVVITTVRKCEGYTLTSLRTMITSVYASNNATREQLEGRINRPGTPYSSIYMYTVHTCILTKILERYDDARSLSEAIKAISA